MHSQTTYHFSAIVFDGTVTCWITTNSNMNCALGSGDTSYLSYASHGQIVVDLGVGKVAKQLALGHLFACALLTDGNVKCWGRSRLCSHVDLGVGRTATQLSAGTWFVCALLDDATVKCWGSKNYGQLGLGHLSTMGTQSSDMGDRLPTVDLGAGRTARQISCGQQHSCALLGDLTVWGNWGWGMQTMWAAPVPAWAIGFLQWTWVPVGLRCRVYYSLL